MKILVTYASRRGSNAEIAARIGQQLLAAGHEVIVGPCSEAPGAADFDAVILGSALYVGRWDRTAVGYLASQASQLRGRPTYLFQSGPCGEGFDLAHVKTPRAVRRLAAQLGLQPPVTFGGRLERSRGRTRLDRWMATGALAGDFRDWDQVKAWTAHIVAQLAEPRPASVRSVP